MFKNGNKLIAASWERFRRVYSSKNKEIGGPIAFMFIDKLFEYAYDLSGKETPIEGDHFVLQISKHKVASDIGIDDSSLRAKKKNGSIYDHMKRIGFKFEDGKLKRNTEDGKVEYFKITKFYIPLYIAEEFEDKDIHVGSYYEQHYGQESALNYIRKLEEVIENKGEYTTVSWNERNWAEENINNYKVHKNLSREAQETRTVYTYFCLLAKHGINPNENGKQHFEEIKTLIYKNAKGNIQAVYKAITSLYYLRENFTMETLFARLRTFVAGELNCTITGSKTVYLTSLKEEKRNESIVDSFDIQLAKLNQKLNNNPDKKLEIIEKEIEKLHNKKFSTLYYDYLNKIKSDLIKEQKELDKAKQEIEHLFDYDYDYDNDYELDKILA